MTTRGRVRGQFRRSRRGPRPATGWTNASLEPDTTLSAGSTTIVDLLGAFTVAEKFNIGTILRVFGEVVYRSQTVNANILGRFGLAIVSDDALAAGALPDPLGDDKFGWYWNAVMLWDDTELKYRSSPVNVVTKRKLIGDASTLALVLEGDATVTMDFGFGLRILYQKK